MYTGQDLRMSPIESGRPDFSTVGSKLLRISDVDGGWDDPEDLAPVGSLALLRKSLYEASSAMVRRGRVEMGGK